jgi:hypothetical protein
MKETA